MKDDYNKKFIDVIKLKMQDKRKVRMSWKAVGEGRR